VEPIRETRDVLGDMVGEGQTELAAALVRMGRDASRIVPELVGLSLGVVDDELTFTLEATDREVAAIDAVQYLDGGPCVRGGHAPEGDSIEVSTQDQTDEGTWQMFARASAAAGIASSLTLPIEADGSVQGTINLYASTPDAFEGKHAELAEALGASARGAVANADLSFATRLEATRAPERYADQDDVDVAVVYICMSQDVQFSVARERLRAAAARAGITEGQAARAIKVLAE
jgi:GAF domain-containing protein